MGSARLIFCTDTSIGRSRSSAAPRSVYLRDSAAIQSTAASQATSRPASRSARRNGTTWSGCTPVASRWSSHAVVNSAMAGRRKSPLGSLISLPGRAAPVEQVARHRSIVAALPGRFDRISASKGRDEGVLGQVVGQPRVATQESQVASDPGMVCMDLGDQPIHRVGTRIRTGFQRVARGRIRLGMSGVRRHVELAARGGETAPAVSQNIANIWAGGA